MDLRDSIQKSKEERMKKLEALREAKKKREEGKKSTTYLEPSKREDMNVSYNSELSMNMSIDNISPGSLPLKSDIGIKQVTKISVLPKAKSIHYEREIQVEIETDSEDEEQLEGMKGVRSATVDKNSKVDNKEEEVKAEVQKTKELDPEEAEAIVSTPGFQDFFNRCAFVVEQALDEKFDVIENFILQQKIEDPFDQKGKMKLLHQLQFAEEDRCVSSLEWSPHFDDTIVASYIKPNVSECKSSQGIINIWHLEDPSKPKHTLYSQSSVTQAQIYPNDPNILLGGTYGGQLLIWDLRAKALPIQRSPALSKGHSYPIVGIAFAESRHSSNAISLSSDGKFCVWMMSLLQTPEDTFGNFYVEIKHRNELCVNCLDFMAREPWSYTIGTEEGTVISGVLQGAQNIEKEEIAVTQMAPVTSVHNHPVEENDLLLVSAVDWTVKLYQKSTQRQLLTIDSYEEYVYDAKWSPSNPSLFACTDGDGNLDVWDLGKSFETPYTRQHTCNKALNKVAWDGNGYRIAAGNSASGIYVYQLDKEYVHGRNEDWLKNLMHLNVNPV